MFTRGVITDEISQDLERAAAMAARYGLQQLEIRTAWDVRVDHMAPPLLRRARDTAARHGLGIVSLASPVFKCALQDKAQYAEHMEILRRCIAAAHALEAGLIRVFTFWRQGELAEHLDRIVEHFQEPARLALRAGVVLAVENEPECYAGTGQELACFLAAVNSPVVRAVWDPENAHRSGQEGAVPRGYAAVRPYVAHVHLKDVMGRQAPFASCVLGRGDVDILSQLRALAGDGYTGCVSLETHYRVKRPLTAADAGSPGGSAFSAGGEEASELCLISWDRLMERLET